MTQKELNTKIETDFMPAYYELKERKNDLIDTHRSAIGTLEYNFTTIPKNYPLGNLIDKSLMDYELKNKGTETVRSFEAYQTKNLPVVQKSTSLLEEKSYTRVRTKTGFVNIVVILYGILNIGMILAMAIMK